jgi:hypothetical protein
MTSQSRVDMCVPTSARILMPLTSCLQTLRCFQIGCHPVMAFGSHLCSCPRWRLQPGLQIRPCYPMKHMNRNLGPLVRQSPMRMIRNNTRALPVSALLIRSQQCHTELLILLWHSYTWVGLSSHLSRILLGLFMNGFLKPSRKPVVHFPPWITVHFLT